MSNAPQNTLVPSKAPVKLRSACDACSVAKVKCDKKNSCDRCRTNGFTCSYSPSRRHGKQLWARRVAEQQQQYLHSTMTNPPPSTTRMSPFDRMPQQYNAPNVLTPPAMPSASLDDHMIGVSNQDSQPEYSSLSGFDLGEGLDFLAQWSSVDSGVDLASSAAGSISTPVTSEADATPIVEQQPPVHDCESKAFTTLHSLHYCTIIHSERPARRTQGRPSFSQVSNRMPPLDKVLFFNRVAISTLRELLECPCAQQPHLALLYMTIVSKTLFWYRLAVNPHYESLSPVEVMPGSPRNRSNSNISPLPSGSIPASPTDLTGRSVKGKTIQIGVFDLGEEDEKLLMRSVLLREVKKAECAVEAMKSLNAAQARDEYGDEEQHMSSWYAVGGLKLEKEVQDTLKQVKEMGVRKTTRD